MKNRIGGILSYFLDAGIGTDVRAFKIIAPSRKEII
jgi:hypothetical protein